jgi:hypothetical protein
MNWLKCSIEYQAAAETLAHVRYGRRAIRAEGGHAESIGRWVEMVIELQVTSSQRVLGTGRPCICITTGVYKSGKRERELYSVQPV